ncbi:TPA: glutamate/gamma-aminobutyrate family transporter YjeM, partial [Salmonella enterica subsp. enterica serovar Narashino]
EKNFAKGIVFAAIVISIGYSLAIFLWGVSTNWQQILSNSAVNLGNITYILMSSLGTTLGNALNLSPDAAMTVGVWFARITGLSMFLAYTGAFFTLSYSPLKAIIQGTPKALWPAPMTTLNANGMPATAMWLQCVLVSLFILLVSFGGDTASAFYNKLTLMANVSMTLPYLFLALAFPFFKARQDLERPFVLFKTKASTLVATGVVVLVVTFANVFTIIQPVIEAGDWDSALWMIGGPIFFSLLAMAIYQNYSSRMSADPEWAAE